MAEQRARPNAKICVSCLVLFFCLFSGFVFAATPTVGTISPSSGTTTPNIARTFTCTYSDADGWSNIKETYLLISLSFSPLTNCAYLYYNQNTNLLYVRNDQDTAWLGGYAPGSTNTIENSYIKVNCRYSTVFGSGTSLTVKWNITFKPAYSGRTYGEFLKVVDDNGNSTSWVRRGAYTVNNPPAIGSITPSTGQFSTSQPVIFNSTYSDQDGYLNILNGYLLINSSTNPANCLYAFYNPKLNKLYLMDNSGLKSLGGYAPGLTNTIENSYAKLDCKTTSVSGAGTTLTVNWSVIFKDSFTGSKNLYLSVRDYANAYVSWTNKGNIQIALADTTPPEGTITINNNSQYTNNMRVTLNLLATDSQSGLDKMQFSNDNITWSAPEPYAATKTWDITSGDGEKTVYVKFSDKALNWSQAVSDTIIVDTAPPVIIITSPKDGALSETQQIILSGTIDGQPFSEEVTLDHEGENTVTKIATDAAGNQNSISIKVYLYLGVIVGSEGGEAVSPDGKAKVLIPPDALSAPTRIKVLPVSNEALQGAVPSGRSLLSVVECKPYGLTFNKSISLVYTLLKPEIPGTPVELGYYDSEQARIIFTGQASTVPADGRTLTFPLSHFSTYAALRNLTSQGGPVGGGAEIPLPDLFTGAFSHAIKIQTPPGRKGIEPNLSLLYRSHLRNGWLGYGWELNPGCIERDVKEGVPTYVDESAAFDLGDSSDGELSITSGTVVIKETKNYTNVYVGPDATLTCDAWNSSTGTGGELIIKCKGVVNIEGKIDVSGKGYRGGTITGGSAYQGESYSGSGGISYVKNGGGGGGGQQGQEEGWYCGDGGGGGGYGTAGNNGGEDRGGAGQGGDIYGNEQMDILYLGSGGGGGGSFNAAGAVDGGGGGAGGGAVKITAHSIIIKGSISAAGANGNSAGGSSAGGGGGGSGGSIFLMSNNVALAGDLRVNGGGGGNGGRQGGSGGKGRIKVLEVEKVDNFAYSFSGSRTDLVNLVDNLYQSKIESGFVKFFKQTDNSWLAVQKDGTKLYFGTSASSKIINSLGTYKWFLDKVEDTNGNYMTFTYAQDAGQAYLNRINYTGNSTAAAAPTHTVDFILEDRADKLVSNLTGSSVTTQKRLKEVDIKVNGGLARKYVFNYTYSPDTNRSLLSSIDQYGSDGATKFPTMTFRYRGKQ
ncbi:MAG: SpvB/TcaC N-terminal domain-containing protein [Candidatus Omnitrophica bacterium]|nr:SpvB/TcaC N-terminal domain-containing protein [Candidatus Omnitrophota bacterium]